MSNSSLVRHFLGVRPDESLEPVALQGVLERVCQSAREAWPPLVFEDSNFVRYLASEYKGSSLQSLDEARIGDMLLGHLCGQGDKAALAVFEKEYLSRIPAMLSHMKLGASLIDEVTQVVRMKILVAESEEAPKIAGYASRGKLDGLVQVVATRAAISMTRKAKPEAREEELLAIPDPNYDLGLHHLKESYREAFAQCFEEAVKTLSRRDRNLLRLHLLDKLTLEQLATMYRVHRATVVRWLAKARNDLFASTKIGLAERLKIEAHEFESLMKLIESRLDVSVERMLQSMGSKSNDLLPDAP